MAATQKRCTIGTGLKVACSGEPKFRVRSQYTERELHLFERRTGVSVSEVCDVHDKQFRVLYAAKQKSCCNPLNAHKSSSVRRSLWTVSSEMHDKCLNLYPVVVEGKKLCNACRKSLITLTREAAHQNQGLAKEVADDIVHGEVPIGAGPAQPTGEAPGARAAGSDLSETQSQGSSTESSEAGGSSGSVYSPRKCTAEKLNKAIAEVGESPLDLKKAQRSKKYTARKFQKAKSGLRRSFQKVAGDIFADQEPGNVSSDEGTDLEEAGKDIIAQLKRKFDGSTTRSEKVQIISVVPASWSLSKITRVFGASKHMAIQMRKLVNEQGVLCTPNIRKGRELPETTITCVQNFYREEDISKELTGLKQVKSVLESGNRVHKQKRLVLGNLKEIFETFRERYPNIKIGFSKFAELRPAECVLAGSSGTHTVCVCLIHENFKLMFGGARLTDVKLEDGQTPFKDYKCTVDFCLCKPATPACFLSQCDKCPGVNELKTVLDSYFTENFIDEVSYCQWTQVDRCQLVTVTQSVDEFTEQYLEYIPKLKEHHFIAKEQAQFYRKTKTELKFDEVLVVADFSENYHFVLQNAIQGVHWNTNQATIHPFACYFKCPESDTVKPINLVIISDCTSHVTATFYTFQSELCAFLKSKLSDRIRKVVYFSDGAPSQYKNKYNLRNLMHHKEDFGLEAEWHFYATSHGRGPSDGLGGRVKSSAARASLQLPPERQLQTPVDLMNWAQEHIKGMSFVFVSQQTVDEITSSKLSRRFRSATPVTGIRSCHTAIPKGKEDIILKRYSAAAEERTVRLLDTPSTSHAENDQPTRRVTRSAARNAMP